MNNDLSSVEGRTLCCNIGFSVKFIIKLMENPLDYIFICFERERNGCKCVWDGKVNIMRLKYINRRNSYRFSKLFNKKEPKTSEKYSKALRRFPAGFSPIFCFIKRSSNDVRIRFVVSTRAIPLDFGPKHFNNNIAGLFAFARVLSCVHPNAKFHVEKRK